MDNAYLFGRLAGYNFDDDVIVVDMISNVDDYDNLSILRDIANYELDIRRKSDKYETFYFTMDLSKYDRAAIKTHYETTPHVKDFIRGYFEECGSIEMKSLNTVSALAKKEVVIEIACATLALMKAIIDFAKPIPCSIEGNNIVFMSTNAIDFFGYLYTHAGVYKKQSLMTRFSQIVNGTDRLPECKIFKTDHSAILPIKAKESDVGYDVSIIRMHKKLTGTCSLYDTGIKVSVDHGYYTEIVPRSSLSKSGYMLANSTGIIDRSYTGNLYLALVKIDPDTPEIQFPFKCCQLIFRKQVFMEIVDSVADFSDTARGEGGFGSSNYNTK
jgi:deoxyuridine 5'-triphosphate nucleotidohydrolase